MQPIAVAELTSEAFAPFGEVATPLTGGQTFWRQYLPAGFAV
jgi:ureidoglycolate hydrolase